MPISIAGIEFERVPGIRYRHDYGRIADAIARGGLDELEALRGLVLNDLWFVVYFVMGVPYANCKYVVERCREVEDGAANRTLDIWARGGFKSTVITVAETVQYHLKNPEHCTCIFSYKKPAAEDFLDSVRKTYEKEILRRCFPHLLYAKPETQAASWSLQGGITLNRSNISRKEATVEASGLLEGMLTGKHFERRIYDDIETADLAENPDQLEKCLSRFEMSRNMGTGRDDDIERVIGTYYSHCGPLVGIRDTEDAEGRRMYSVRVVPATDDGTPDGKPVLVSEAKLAELRVGRHFYSQQLCDPTPRGSQRLDSGLLVEVEPEMVPRNLYRVMAIDAAGDDKTGKGDAWAMLVVGVEPRADAETGLCNVYITNATITPLPEKDAPNEVVKLYLAGGYVQKIGVEKVGLSTTEVHVANALEQRGVRISEEAGTLVILRPAGRKKADRIEKALSWPLNNGKIHISKSVPRMYRDRLRAEMDKFPFWHDDGLDALSYVYDMIADIRFDGYGGWDFEGPDNEEAKEPEMELAGKSRICGY